jgi:predicted  nucleic acid-binding Zn-ribbon protein
MKQTDAVLYQDRLTREQERLKQEVSAREFAQLERTTTTRHDPFVDMRDALAQVRAKEHQQTQQEVEFRRFTSGGFIDNAKGH